MKTIIAAGSDRKIKEMEDESVSSSCYLMPCILRVWSQADSSVNQRASQRACCFAIHLARVGPGQVVA